MFNKRRFHSWFKSWSMGVPNWVAGPYGSRGFAKDLLGCMKLTPCWTPKSGMSGWYTYSGLFHCGWLKCLCWIGIPLIVVILLYLQISKIITKTIIVVGHPRNNHRHVIHVISKFGHAQLHPSHASIENLPPSDFLKPSTSYSTFISGSIIFVHPCYSH